MTCPSIPQDPPAGDLLLPLARVDLPKTTRILDASAATHLAPVDRAQRELESLQSMFRSGRSVGFVKVRHLTAENAAEALGPMRVTVTSAGICLTPQSAAEPHTSPDT